MSAVATVPLGDVASFVRGITFKPDDVGPLGADGLVACMRTKNVQADLDASDVWGIPASIVKRPDQYLRPGDVLVSSANSWNLVGKCCWVPKLPWASTFGGFISALRADTSQVDPRYLYHWFSSSHVQATVRSFGRQTTNISNLSIERCRRMLLPLPPLPEQRRIADILDKADALRAKRRAALKKLDELTQSIFLDMFGNPATNPKKLRVAALCSLGDVITGTTPPSARAGMFGGAIPFVTPGDLESRQPVKRTVTEDGAAASRTVRVGATLVCCIGATIGKMSNVPVRSAFNQQINAIQWGSDVEPRYGLACMRFFKSKIIAWGASTTLPILKKSTFAKIEIPVPPYVLQQGFSSTIAAVEALMGKCRDGANLADDLFCSLQHRAFRSEL